MQLTDMVAVVALVMAALGWRRSAKLQKAFEQAVKEAESLRSHVTASNNILERKLEDLRSAMNRRVEKSDKRFHADMTVAQVLSHHPEAGAVMASFHLGGCSSCAISEHHVLGPAAESYGVDIDALLTALNNLLNGGPVPAKQPHGAGLLSIDASV